MIGYNSGGELFGFLGVGVKSRSIFVMADASSFTVMSKLFQVRIHPFPSWLDWRRLLGPGEWDLHELEEGDIAAHAELPRSEAADLSARLRGVGIGGKAIECQVSPSLHRRDLKRAHTEEARRYREGSRGFELRAVRLDDEGRVSLTPEALALELGQRVKGSRVIDAFAGAGGNAIGFARAGCDVVAIEIDESRLAMARHNAKVYGVEGRIEFVAGDAREYIANLAGDVLFLDPPWGERYNKTRVTLDELSPCRELLAGVSGFAEIWVKVPPSFDPSELPGFLPEAIYGVGKGDNRRVKFLLMKKTC